MLLENGQFGGLGANAEEGGRADADDVRIQTFHLVEIVLEQVTNQDHAKHRLARPVTMDRWYAL